MESTGTPASRRSARVQVFPESCHPESPIRFPLRSESVVIGESSDVRMHRFRNPRMMKNGIPTRFRSVPALRRIAYRERLISAASQSGSSATLSIRDCTLVSSRSIVLDVTSPSSRGVQKSQSRDFIRIFSAISASPVIVTGYIAIIVPTFDIDTNLFLFQILID